MDNSTLLADMASLQLEFFTLSHYTGNPIFAKKVRMLLYYAYIQLTSLNQAQAITDFLDSAGYAHGVRLPGLYPNEIDLDAGYFTDSEWSIAYINDKIAHDYIYMLAIASFGAMGDSAYEVRLASMFYSSFLFICFFFFLKKKVFIERIYPD